MALQILGRKFYTNAKKLSLYSQSLLVFIYKTAVVENHPTTREIRELLWPRSTPRGNHGSFLHEQLAHLLTSTENTQKKVSNMASDEDIMENNQMFVILWNFQLDFPIILSYNNFFDFWREILRGYVAFSENTINIIF